MEISLDRFNKTTVSNSIVDKNNKDINDINDGDKPFSLLQWVINSDLDLGSPEKYISQYKTYLKNWHDVRKEIVTDPNKITISDIYKNLLKEITLDYTTDDEKRYLSNVDFNDPIDLDIVIPFYVTRLKEIVVFLSKNRESIKQQGYAYALLGSVKGTEQKTATLLQEQIDLTGSVVVIDELYDLSDDYHDIDPCTKGYGSFNISSNVFLDFEEAIREEALDLGVLIQTKTNLNALETSEQAIETISNTTVLDVSKFPAKSFIEYVNKDADLNLYSQKALMSSLMGANVSYLSAGPSTVNSQGLTSIPYTIGYLANASHPIRNFYNRNYPTVVYNMKYSELSSKRQLGGYFVPKNLGITVAHSINPRFTIKTGNITPNTTYTFADINRYGNDLPIIDHNDDGVWIIGDKSNGELAGYVADSHNLQKFDGYQTVIEDNPLHTKGVARYDDSFDFWAGELKDIWKNADVYRLKLQNLYNLEGRQLEALSNRQDVYKWKSDAFGNDYVLFKSKNPGLSANLTDWSELSAASEGTTPYDVETWYCNFIDHGHFLTDSYTATADGGNFTYTADSYTATAYGATFYDNMCVVCDVMNGFTINQSERQMYEFQCDVKALNVQNNTAAVTIVDSLTSNTDIASISKLDSYINNVPESTIYEHRNEILNGDLWVRNANGTIIKPVSEAFVGIFDKYDTNIKNELLNNIRDFDIIYDVLIIYTENYVVIEKIGYNYSDNTFKQSTHTNYISVCGNSLEENITHFFNEKTNTIYIGSMREYTSGVNSDSSLYPEIYGYNVNTFKTQKLFPYDGFTDFDEFNIPQSIPSFSGTAHINKIDTPILTYNDKSDMFYVVNSVDININGTPSVDNLFGLFKSKFKLSGDKMELQDSAIYWSHGTDYDTDYDEKRTEFVELSAGTGSYNITPAVTTPELTLTVSVSSLASGKFYNKLMYDNGDGDVIVVSRPHAGNLPGNIDDVDPGNPMQFNINHTYYTGLSTSGAGTFSVSAVDSSFDVEIYNINYTTEPYTIHQGFSGMKVVECRPYINVNNQEVVCIILESVAQKYLTAIEIHDTTYNSISI